MLRGPAGRGTSGLNENALWSKNVSKVIETDFNTKINRFL